MDSSAKAEKEWLEDYDSPETKWGYLNGKGVTVIPPQFDDCKPFKSSVACVSKNGYWGVIDKAGNWLVDPTYKGLWPIQNGRFRFQDFERRYGYIDIEGEEVISSSFIDAYDFSEGLAAVRLNKVYGYIDTIGKSVIDTLYESAGQFRNGFAIVANWGRFGVINAIGEMITEFEYERIKQGEAGIFSLYKEGVYTILDTKNEIIFNSISANYVSSVEDKLFFSTHESGSRIYNVDNNSTSDVPFRIQYYAGNRRFVFSRNGHMGLCDTNGRILAEGYDQILRFGDNRAAFSKDELWGFIDNEGKEIISATWPLCWPFEENTARVITSNGISIIDTNGISLVTPLVSELRQAGEGLFAFKL